MSDTNDVRTEWGVRLTWPDGYREVRTHDRINDRPYSRRDAELVTENATVDYLEGKSTMTATLVYREITATAWTPRGPESADEAMQAHDFKAKG